MSGNPAFVSGGSGAQPPVPPPGPAPGPAPGDPPPPDQAPPERATRPAAYRRFLAWLVDFAVVVAVAVGLGFLTYHRVAALVKDVPGLAERGVWEIVTSRGDVLEATADLGRSVWGSIVLAVQQAFGLLVLFTFLYHFLCLAYTGRTLGKLVVDLRVEPRVRGRAARRAAVTTLADVGLFAVACCLLVDGRFALSVLCWVAAVVLFWANALPTLFGPGRSLADRVAGTSVAASQLYRAVARATAEGSRAAWQASQQLGQRVGQAGQQLGQRFGQASQQLGQQVTDPERRRAAFDRARAAADRVRRRREPET